MKRMAFALLCCLFISLVYSQSNIVICKNDDTKHSFKMSDVDSMYFSNTDTVSHSQYNYVFINDTIKGKSIKILDIGNSFTNDAVEYLPKIIKSLNADVSNVALYKLYRGSASFKTWYDCYNGRDTKKYSYSKVAGGLNVKVSGKTDTIDGKFINNELMVNVLNKVKWDIIIIHQVSDYSDDYSGWTSKKSCGYLNEFLAILKQTQPDAKLGFLLTHSSNKRAIAKKMGTEDFTNAMIKSYPYLYNKYNVRFIIPVGTAIENLRQTIYDDDYHFTKDNHHLVNGLAKYTAACAYYESLLEPITHKSIMNDVKTTVNISSKTGDYSLPIDVDAETREMGKKAAYLGTHFWWKVLNPENFAEIF